MQAVRGMNMKNNMLNSMSINEVMQELMSSADLGGIEDKFDFIDNITKQEEEELYRPITEIEAFCSIDSLCSELYAQLEQAKENLSKIIREHGCDSAMAEIAKDMVESAETSLEVRLIELREDETSSGEAGDLIFRVNREIEKDKEASIDRKKAKKREDLARMFMEDIQDRKEHKQRTNQEIFSMMALFVLWMQKIERQREAVGVKNDFIKASSLQGGGFAYALL